MRWIRAFMIGVFEGLVRIGDAMASFLSNEDTSS